MERGFTLVSGCYGAVPIGPDDYRTEVHARLRALVLGDFDAGLGHFVCRKSGLAEYVQVGADAARYFGHEGLVWELKVRDLGAPFVTSDCSVVFALPRHGKAYKVTREGKVSIGSIAPLNYQYSRYVDFDRGLAVAEAPVSVAWTTPAGKELFDSVTAGV